jgi:hypothetical protein
MLPQLSSQNFRGGFKWPRLHRAPSEAHFHTTDASPRYFVCFTVTLGQLVVNTEYFPLMQFFLIEDVETEVLSAVTTIESSMRPAIPSRTARII